MRQIYYVILFVLATSFAQASSFQFSCTAYTNYYQTYNSGTVVLASTVEGQVNPLYPNYLMLTSAQTQALRDQQSAYCVSWARNRLNGLSVSVLPIGGWATVTGAGYLYLSNGQGFNIVMATTSVSKTSAPVVRPIYECGNNVVYGRPSSRQMCF